MFSNKYKSIIFASVFLLSAFCFLLSTPVSAAELNLTFPCSSIAGGTCPTAEQTASSPAAYIARFYQFALMISGALAFAMIIFGAIQYIVSAGNSTAQSDARDRIFQAFWGIALLLGAYLILYTIDPKMVSLTDPKLEILKMPAEIKTRAIGNEGDKCQATADCISGLTCQNGRCVLSEERKQEQESGNYYWVDFGDPGIQAKYGNECSGMGKVRYADNYCPGLKLGPNYQCCGS